MVRWNFPGNQDGQIKGVADAGIENFNVMVEFERYYISTSQIPGIEEYRDVLKKCEAFWKKSNSEKAKEFLKAG